MYETDCCLVVIHVLKVFQYVDDHVPALWHVPLPALNHAQFVNYGPMHCPGVSVENHSYHTVHCRADRHHSAEQNTQLNSRNYIERTAMAPSVRISY